MIDLRAHVAAVVAVFVALALGMLLGATGSQGGGLLRWQEAALARVEGEVARQRSEQARSAATLAALRAAVAADAAFAQAALPWLTADRLRGRTVVVAAAGQSALAERLLAELTAAGAATRTLPLAGPPPTPPPTAAAVVLVEGWQDIDAAARLVPVLTGAGLRVVGAEPKATAPAADALFARLGLSFVDDVDDPEGQAALVLLLSGRQGHYGRDATAQGPLPPP